MPSRSAFTYAVLRVVPDIEREEFVNAGLILFDRERRFLRARTDLDVAALAALAGDCDLDAIRRSSSWWRRSRQERRTWRPSPP